jgi:hypothetical protein
MLPGDALQGLAARLTGSPPVHERVAVLGSMAFFGSQWKPLSLRTFPEVQIYEAREPRECLPPALSGPPAPPAGPNRLKGTNYGPGVCT